MSAAAAKFDLPHIVEVVLTAAGGAAKRDGGATGGSASADGGGLELRVSFKERRVRLPAATFAARFPHLLRRWRLRMRQQQFLYNLVTGHCVPEDGDTAGPDAVDPDSLQLKVGTVHLTMPSALFADCFAEALTCPAAYALRPHTQFTYYSIACMLAQEARLIQAERFIANNLCTGTALFALQHAARFGRTHLLSLCYAWLRRTGGVTPGFLLTRPERALRVDVSAGLLYQWDPQAGEWAWFDLASLREIVAAERARKRAFYVPVRTESYNPSVHSYEATRARARAERQRLRDAAAAAVAGRRGAVGGSSDAAPRTPDAAARKLVPAAAADDDAVDSGARFSDSLAAAASSGRDSRRDSAGSASDAEALFSDVDLGLVGSNSSGSADASAPPSSSSSSTGAGAMPARRGDSASALSPATASAYGHDDDDDDDDEAARIGGTRGSFAGAAAASRQLSSSASASALAGAAPSSSPEGRDRTAASMSLASSGPATAGIPRLSRTGSTASSWAGDAELDALIASLAAARIAEGGNSSAAPAAGAAGAADSSLAASSGSSGGSGSDANASGWGAVSLDGPPAAAAVASAPPAAATGSVADSSCTVAASPPSATAAAAAAPRGSPQSLAASSASVSAAVPVAGYHADASSVDVPSVAFPFAPAACIAVEVGCVRSPELVQCTEGDRGMQAAAAATAAAASEAAAAASRAASGSAGAAAGTSAAAEAAPPPVALADTSALFSGPGSGWPELMRCYVVRRRDGRGACRVCRNLEREWQGIVASRFGFDGDENAVGCGTPAPAPVPSATAASSALHSGSSASLAASGGAAAAAAVGAAAAAAMPPCPSRGGAHATLRRTAFDDAEMAVPPQLRTQQAQHRHGHQRQPRSRSAAPAAGASRRGAAAAATRGTSAPSRPCVPVPLFAIQAAPCPYHDGARPIARRDDGGQWELGTRLFQAGYAHHGDGSDEDDDDADAGGGRRGSHSEEDDEVLRGLLRQAQADKRAARAAAAGGGSAHGDDGSADDDNEDNHDDDDEHGTAEDYDSQESASDGDDDAAAAIRRGPTIPSAAGALTVGASPPSAAALPLVSLTRSSPRGGWPAADAAAASVPGGPSLAVSAALPASAALTRVALKPGKRHCRSRFPRRLGDLPSRIPAPIIQQLRQLRRRCTCDRGLYSAPPTRLTAALAEAIDGPTAGSASASASAAAAAAAAAAATGAPLGTVAGAGGGSTSAGTLAALASHVNGTSALRAASVVPGNADALGPPGCRHVFELRRELDDSLVAVAVCTGTGGKFNFFTSPHPLLATSAPGASAAPGDPHAYLGTTSCNLLGTCITVHDWGMPVDVHAANAKAPPSERPIPTLPLMLPPGTDLGAGPAGPLLGHPCGFLPGLGQRELARISYDSNILASAPNRMTVELRSHDDYDALDLMRSKALGRPVGVGGSSGFGTGASSSSGSGGGGGSGGSGAGGAGGANGAVSGTTLSHAALFGLPAEATAADSSSLLSLRATAGGDGDGSGSGSGGAGSGGGGLSIGPLSLPDVKLAASGLLAKPSEMDFRSCTPSSGFGLGIGASSGVGSWAGMLSAAWSSLVGSSAGATQAEAAAGLKGLTAAASLAGKDSASSSAKAAAAAAVTSASLAAAGAAAVAPYAVLMTRRPRWSDRLDAWTMDFRGRVLKASKKNFQLVAVPMAHKDAAADTYTTDHSSPPALLFGKVAKDRYSLDFAPGCLGPVQAFAIALTTFASKLAVA